MSDVLSSPRATLDAGAGFAAPPARPLGAADLRLMAAWASDHPATELVFASGGTEADPRITRVPPGGDAGQGVVVVPAGGAARLGQLLTLTSEVNGTRGETDALRWSAAFLERGVRGEVPAPLPCLAGRRPRAPGAGRRGPGVERLSGRPAAVRAAARRRVPRGCAAGPGRAGARVVPGHHRRGARAVRELPAGLSPPLHALRVPRPGRR